MVPTLVENSIFFVYLLVNFFVNNIIMTGEPMHTVKELASYVNYRLKSEASIRLYCQLCHTCYTAL